MMAKWLRVAFKDAKTHLVCASLYRPLVADLAARGHSVLDFKEEYGRSCPGAEALDRPEYANPKVVTAWGIDMPGMVHKHRPMETFRWCGLKFEVPSEDVAAFALQIAQLKERRFEGGRWYFKLHGYAAAIVLTPIQRTVLGDALRDRLLGAEQRATAFWAGRQTPAEILQEAYGTKDDLGGHKVDRFAKPKAGGTA